MNKVTPLKTIAGDPLKPIEISDIVIPCYVLEGELRVITESGLYSALDLSRSGRNSTPTSSEKDLWAEIENTKYDLPKNKVEAGTITTELPRFAQSKWLRPHISPKLTRGLKTRYVFKMPNGAIAHGFKATILAGVCRAILKAHHKQRLNRKI